MQHKMKLRSKLILPFSIIQILLLLAICGVTSWTIQANEEKKKTALKETELAKTKQTLDNYMDIAFESIDSNFRKSKDPEYLQSTYGQRMVNIIDIAQGVIQKHIQSVKSGEKSLEQALLLAKEELRVFRYDKGAGYIWINDTTRPFPKILMHPLDPSLEGRVMDDSEYNCVLGPIKNLYHAILDACDKNGQGFIYYEWPKLLEDGATKKLPKLSYVRLIPEWNWVLGTGIYVDEAFSDAVRKTLQDIAQMRYEDGRGYFWINDMSQPVPRMVMHPISPELNGKALDDPKYNCAMGTKKNLFQAAVEMCQKHGQGFVEYLWSNPTADGRMEQQEKISHVRLYKPMNWIIGTGTYTDAMNVEIAAKKAEMDRQVKKELNDLILKLAATLAVITLVSAFLMWLVMSKVILHPIEKVLNLTDHIRKGDLSRRLKMNGGDEIAQLATAMDSMADGLDAKSRLASSISRGDLTHQATMVSKADTLGRALKRMTDHLHGMVDQIRAGCHLIARGSMELSNSSSSLSQGATEQAAAIEEISGSMNDLASRTNANASSAGEANRLSIASNQTATIGNSKMEEVVSAMGEINESSQEISKIIKVIDDIAFQTNLLALNAAVEAARAGKHGKGFAVVAQEVRGLAARSAKAAGETAELIETGLKKADLGSQIVDQTALSFREIMESTQKVTELLAQIAESSSEQARGISQINQGLEQVSQVTQENTASAEQTASAALELSRQAERQRQLVSRFKVRSQLTGIQTHSQIEHFPQEGPAKDK